MENNWSLVYNYWSPTTMEIKCFTVFSFTKKNINSQWGVKIQHLFSLGSFFWALNYNRIHKKHVEDFKKWPGFYSLAYSKTSTGPRY